MRFANPSRVGVVVVCVIAAMIGTGCTIEVVMKAPDLGGGGATGGAPGAPGPTGMSPGGVLEECLPTETTGLPTCCDPYGAGHCLPDDQVPPDMVGHTAACDGGGACVPDERILLGGGYAPVSCASIGGAAGACLS